MPAAFSSSSVLPTDATSGARIDDVRYDVVVHVAGLPGDDLGNGDAFIFRLVRQHRPRDDVTDGENARDVGLEMAIDEHALLGVERDTGLGESKPFGERHAADRDQHDIGFNGFGGPPAAGSMSAATLRPRVSTAATLLDSRIATPCFFEDTLERSAISLSIRAKCGSGIRRRAHPSRGAARRTRARVR